MGQKPRSPASFSVSEPLLTPATPMGGCGFWNGLMCGRSVSSRVPVFVTCQYLPLWSNSASSLHSRSMISSDSRVISRCWPEVPSTLNMAQSLGRPLAATPKLRRPWARWSSIATRLASSAGWWYGIRKPPGPMRMRVVCNRAWATSRSGEGWGSQGAV